MVGGFAAGPTVSMASLLERVVYRSDAVASTDGPIDLSSIVATSVRNNARRRMTGALALHDGTFVQVLEGEPEALTTLMDTIATDERHRNVRVLARWPVQSQLFLGWAMVQVDTRALSQHLAKLMIQTGSGAQVTGVMADLANARLTSLI